MAPRQARSGGNKTDATTAPITTRIFPRESLSLFATFIAKIDLNIMCGRAIFAKTVLLEDEPEVGDGTQYNRRSRAQSGSVGITLPHDDRSNTSSPTTPTPWSKESKPPASMVSVTTRSSQDQHYRSSSRRRSQSQERPAPPVSRGPTHRTHQSLGGRQDFSDPTMNNIPTEKDLNYVESGGVQDHQDGRGRWKG